MTSWSVVTDSLYCALLMSLLLGKPYRMTEIEMAYPDFEMYMFRQACTWSSFTIDREEFVWNYKTFLSEHSITIGHKYSEMNLIPSFFNSEPSSSHTLPNERSILV